jgi:molybdopterin biosynthesis enzyme
MAVSDGELRRAPDGKVHFLRGRVRLNREGEWRVQAESAQESNQLHALAAANALIVVPDGHGKAAGQPVEVLLLDPAGLTNVDGHVLDLGGVPGSQPGLS